MSETDSFIQEVTDEVRQDRMFRLWKKYGPYGIGAIIAIVVVSAGLTWMKHRAEQQARAAGGAFLAADIGSIEAQEQLSASVDGPAAVVARLRLAAAKAAAGETGAAAETYRAVADEPGLDRAYADLARLQAVRVAAAEMDSTQAIAELDRIIGPGAPYRLLALELRAAILLNRGDTDAAHADLQEILADPMATRDLRERVGAMLLSSGGALPAAG